MRPWWQNLPSDGATPDTAAELRLRSLLANAEGARKRAVAHTVWSVARLDDIGPGGSSGVIELAGTYARNGAGVSTRLAYAARADVVSCLGVLLDPGEAGTVGATLPERHTKRWGGLLVLGLPQLAAARVVARWAIGSGAMVEPVVATVDVPTEHVLPSQSKRRGRCRCPCGGHRNNDEHPSAVFDFDRGRLSCLATGGRWKLRREGDGWRLMARGVAAEAAGTIDTHSASPGPWPYSGKTVLGTLTGSMSWRSTTDSWIDLFETADEVGNGDDATAAAWQAAMEGEHAACDGRTARPHADQLIALDAWKLEWARKGGRWRPVGKQSLGCGRVLFDLDGLAPRMLSASEWATLGERLDDVIRGSDLFACTGFVTETSSRGIQLIARLEGFRWGSAAFHRSRAVRAELRRVGEAMRQIVGRGGVVDESAFAPGRFARLPGVRLKAGEVVHARLRWTGGKRTADNVVQLDEARRALGRK